MLSIPIEDLIVVPFTLVGGGLPLATVLRDAVGGARVQRDRGIRAAGIRVDR